MDTNNTSHGDEGCIVLSVVLSFIVYLAAWNAAVFVCIIATSAFILSILSPLIALDLLTGWVGIEEWVR